MCPRLTSLGCAWFAVFLVAASSPVVAVAGTIRREPASAAVAEEPNTQARILYEHGATLYATADYDGAIEAFTQALKIANAQGAAPRVGGLLLFNIGKAHVKAYEVRRDVSELRQALAIYGRFVDDAKEGAGYAEGDVRDAESEMVTIRAQLAVLERERELARPVGAGQTAEPSPGTSAVSPATTDTSGRRRPSRSLGLGLVVGGGVAMAAGGGLIAYGAGFRAAALDDPGVNSPHDQLTKDEREFVDWEAFKGRLVMGGGGVLAAAGVATAVLGVLQLRAAKRDIESAQVAVAGVVRPGFAGVGITGRF
ncbi:MAG: hypothetical protein V3V08_15850 [Nannocystaceae bacterium]